MWESMSMKSHGDVLSQPLLEVRNLDAFYGDFQALFGVNLTVYEGQTVAIIGANGAGKTTLLRTLSGLLPAPHQSIRFAGEDIGGEAPFRIVAQGIAMVPEGRRLFPSLTVEENLLVGAYCHRSGFWDLEKIYHLFPILAQRRHQPATQLSGGQQQMVAIGRALMSNPRLLLCDEISLGLAPIVVREIYQHLPEIKAQGTTILVVEQDIRQAINAADWLICLQEGRVALYGAPNQLGHDEIVKAYFGT